MPSVTERVATEDAPRRKPAGAKKTMFRERVPGIFRATRSEPATGAGAENRMDERREGELIHSNQAPGDDPGQVGDRSTWARFTHPSIPGLLRSTGPNV
jgi:hypothetical protein